MKLAEALIERKDIQNRLDALRQRLCACALIQEGEQPAEDPEMLMGELSRLTARHEALCTRINLTNSQNTVDGESLTALLSRRDAMSNHHSIMADFLNAAMQAPRRSSGREIKLVPAVKVSQLRDKLDKESQALRQLDTKIQQANWNIDLM